MEEKKLAHISTYRVPLMLAVSKTPLYIRIDCSNNFPIQKPHIVVLARVYHSIVNDTTKVITIPLLENWNLQNGSNLLAVIRDIHTRFDAEPPVPEKLSKRPAI